MQAALRLARQQRRCLATTANPAHVLSGSTSAAAPKRPVIPLSNVEAQWEKLSSEERSSVHDQLEVLMKKDWKELSIDEKKAAYYVSFGPHGPRTPSSKPGENFKVFLGTAALLGVTGLLFVGIRAIAPAPPKTINKEWEAAMTERALEQKMNPITGISSEGYNGKGFVVTK